MISRFYFKALFQPRILNSRNKVDEADNGKDVGVDPGSVPALPDVNAGDGAHGGELGVLGHAQHCRCDSLRHFPVFSAVDLVFKTSSHSDWKVDVGTECNSS